MAEIPDELKVVDIILKQKKMIENRSLEIRGLKREVRNKTNIINSIQRLRDNDYSEIIRLKEDYQTVTGLLKKEHKIASNQVYKFAEEITELEKQIEKMKCCGNCENHNYGSSYINCNDGNSAPLKENGLSCCDNWKLKGKK